MRRQGSVQLTVGSELVDEALRRVVAEAEHQVVGGFGRRGLTPRKQPRFVGGEGGFDVTGVRGEGLAEFGSVDLGDLQPPVGSDGEATRPDGPLAPAGHHRIGYPRPDRPGDGAD